MKLAEIYASLPTVDCKKRCHGACGPISLLGREDKAVEQAAGRKLRIVEDGSDRLLLGDPPEMVCPLLRFNECSVYAARPIICRLFGVTKRMKCPYGCEPSRWLSEEEAFDLMEQAMACKG